MMPLLSLSPFYDILLIILSTIYAGIFPAFFGDFFPATVLLFVQHPPPNQMYPNLAPENKGHGHAAQPQPPPVVITQVPYLML
jgi:hypothetical protein